MAYKNFKFETDADGIALVTWDMPERSMNVITMAAIEELSGIVEKVATDAAIKGAVITSGNCPGQLNARGPAKAGSSIRLLPHLMVPSSPAGLSFVIPDFRLRICLVICTDSSLRSTP